jgi:diaminopimelate decarboxylase
MPAALSVARLALSDGLARRLADEFGTPLYVLSAPVFRARAQALWSAFGEGEVSFASKSNSTLALLREAHRCGFLIDAASAGETEAAIRAGVPADRIRLHGNYKTAEDLTLAVRAGVGQIVADGLEDVRGLVRHGVRIPVLLRLAPSVETGTQEKISTAHADTKFGAPIATGEALEALREALAAGMDVRGFHVHIGSQLAGPEPYLAAMKSVGAFASQARDVLGFECRQFNLGGGYGVAYLPGQPEPDLAALFAAVRRALYEAFGFQTAPPELGIEPGRWLAAESGVTLYRVGPVKRAASGRLYATVDGGLSDNPRPALYGAAYDARLVSGDGRRLDGPLTTVTVAGRHCETDTLFPDLVWPGEPKPGDLVQVTCTGAYNSAMASNYNRFCRPATVWLEDGDRASLAVVRESFDDLFRNERLPEGD